MSGGLLQKGHLALCLAIFMALVSTGLAIDCVVGKEPNEADDGCEDCPVGYYSDQVDNSPCTKCTDGKTTTATASNAENLCVDDQNCPLGEYYDSNVCEVCPVNSYKATVGAGTATCTPCPGTGRTTAGTGSVAESDCKVSCAAGQQPNQAGDTCEDCPVGSYSNQNDINACTACTNGKTTAATAAAQASLCINSDNCPVGQQHNSGTNVCEVCPVGSYKDAAGNAACTACTGGKTTANTGSVKVGDCITSNNCPLGQYFDSTCKVCPVNSYKATVGAGTSTCTPCASGKNTTGTGSVAESDCNCKEKSLAVQTRPGVALYFCFLLLSFFPFA